jgi:type IV pilus assembly protein PilQ
MSNLTHAIRGKLKLALGLLFLTLGAAHAQDSGRALQSLDFVALEGNRVLVTLTLSEAAPEPVVFTIDKPARLSLDLPDTRVALAERFKKINIGNARSIAAVEAKGRTRVVVELGETAPYSVRLDGNKVYLHLDNTAPALAANAAPTTSAQTSAAAKRAKAAW